MVIISGSSGFIGTNLLKAVPNSKAISLRESGWEMKFNDATAIINLVGKAHDHSGRAPESEYYYSNFEITKRIYEAFINSDANLLVHISSIAAVEEFESLIPLTEDTVCHPQSFYGKSKRSAELWLLDQVVPENKKLIILRPPMVHGPGDKGNLGMLYKFISNGFPYPFSSFNNSRSFLSINNFGFYINSILKDYPKIGNGIYHISDNEPVSTKEIIDIITQETKKKILKVNIPKSLLKVLAKIGDYLPIPINSKRLKKLTSSLLVSNSKINEDLNIIKLPESGKEGIMKTIRWFNGNIK